MKHLFLLLCTGLCLNAAGSPIQEGDNSASPPVLKSTRIFFPVVNISQAPGSINIYFNDSAEEVEIMVTDEAGMIVYQTLTKATACNSMTINNFGWAKGSYTLTIIDGSGKLLHQEFIGL